MVGINQVIVAGNLTADVELKQTTSGVYVCRAGLAVHRKKTKGEEQKTDFFRVVVWRHSAEFLARYAKKGDNIVVIGSLQTEVWTDSNGNKRHDVVIVADDIEINRQKASDATADAVGFQEVADDEELPF